MTNSLLYLQQQTFNHTRLAIVLVKRNNMREIVLKTMPGGTDGGWQALLSPCSWGPLRPCSEGVPRSRPASRIGLSRGQLRTARLLARPGCAASLDCSSRWDRDHLLCTGECSPAHSGRSDWQVPGVPGSLAEGSLLRASYGSCPGEG